MRTLSTNLQPGIDVRRSTAPYRESTPSGLIPRHSVVDRAMMPLGASRVRGF
jgi:hypothetical protein